MRRIVPAVPASSISPHLEMRNDRPRVHPPDARPPVAPINGQVT